MGLLFKLKGVARTFVFLHKTPLGFRILFGPPRQLREVTRESKYNFNPDYRNQRRLPQTQPGNSD